MVAPAMTQVFRRGELKAALLHVLCDGEPINGYVIMQRLTDVVGTGWRASPGAIYPALLALEDAGFITGHDGDGSRLYTLTGSGRRARNDRPDLLAEVSRRAAQRDRPTTLGAVLDAFAGQATDRSHRLDPLDQQEIRAILTATGHRITTVLNQGANHD